MKLVFSAIGRLTKDPETTTKKKGKEKLLIARLSIAVNGSNDRTDFIDCTAFNTAADIAAKYLHKGNNVAVDGRIQQNNYENENGDMVYGYNFIVDQIHLVESKPATGSKGNSSKNNKSSNKKTGNAKNKKQSAKVEYEDEEEDEDEEDEDEEEDPTDDYPF